MEEGRLSGKIDIQPRRRSQASSTLLPSSNSCPRCPATGRPRARRNYLHGFLRTWKRLQRTCRKRHCKSTGILMSTGTARGVAVTRRDERAASLAGSAQERICHIGTRGSALRHVAALSSRSVILLSSPSGVEPRPAVHRVKFKAKICQNKHAVMFLSMSSRVLVPSYSRHAA